MFTGLIEEIGVIRSMRPQGSGFRISVSAHTILEGLKIDDSVSINGACQTVVACGASYFDVEAVEETLLKTTFSSFSHGKRVNLERAMQLGGRLGGHIVQGHVDCRGVVKSIQDQRTSWLLTVEFPENFARYLVPVGSICIDGVSLTAARVTEHSVTVAIIPHTWAHTTLNELRIGVAVNLEFDIIGKYVERMLRFGGMQDATHSSATHASSGMTEEWLTQMGY